MLAYESVLTPPAVNNKQVVAGFANVMSDAGLNVLFSRQLGRYLSASSDLTYNKGYAVLDDEDGRLSIGYTFNYTEDYGEYIRNLTSIGVKSNIADGFSTLWKDAGLQPDIGLALKHSFILGGKLKTGNQPRNAAAVADRNAYVGFLKTKARTDMANWANAEDAAATAMPSKAGLQKVLDARTKAKSKEKGKDLVEAEVDYVEEQKLYTVATNSWITIEGYIPFSESEYILADSITMPGTTTKRMRPYEGRLSYSRYWQKPSGRALFLQFGGLGQLYNNVLDKSLAAVPFEEWRNRGGSDTLLVAQLSTEDVHVGKYNEYVAMAVNARAAVLFPICETGNRMGFSVSFEKYFGGDYSPLNWRLGIPFSLLDKDGKPAVNFELQWREQNKVHSVGLSIGLPIGKFVYE